MAEITNFVRKVRPKGETLTVVGSGIAGLMTAWEAHKAGYDVTVISQSPDPRLHSDNDNPQFSSTFDSKKDQRYITLFEGHPYLELAGYVDKMYPDIANDFTKHVLQGGLLAVPFDEFKKETQTWLNDRLAINHKLHAGDQGAVQSVTKLFEAYEQENRAAMEKWYDFLQDVLQKSPKLFETLSLSDHGILRLYDNTAVFQQAKESHIRGGVFKRELTPDQLKQQYPAYKTGVVNGFIKGGAVEMYGLTLGVKSLGREMINMLEKEGVTFKFSKAVEKVVVENGNVVGLKLKGQDTLFTSKHYMIHPGAFSKPTLFEDIPEVKFKLAAMEGYWISIEGADKLVQAMAYKPNKVHGKQSLELLLSRIPEDSKRHYLEIFLNLGIEEKALKHIAPIVDFNNMPIVQEGKTELGVGSGYIFKGLAYDDGTGKPSFSNDEKSEQFVLTVMKLWLEVLHGKELLSSGSLVVHPIGCKRSWTMDDKEIDVNYPTKDGGVLGIRGGGNTGDTTKSTFIADYNAQLMKAVDKVGIHLNREQLQKEGVAIRNGLRKTSADLGPQDWERKTRELDNVMNRAMALNTISQRSGRNETPKSNNIS